MFVSVPATSANLGPGFDTLGLAVDLRNEISIKPSKFLSISTQGEGAENPKIKKNSLFLSIFNENYKRLSGRSDNFRFEFHNRIPISRGLGSSSAVIVAALSGAYMAAKVKYNKREILNQALRYEHHPDNITPAILGCFCVAKLKKNRVYFLKKFIPNIVKAVVVIPNKPISTNQSRSTLKDMYPLKDVVTNISSASMITAAFFSEKFELLRNIVEDKVHQEARMKSVPELFKVREIALREGALMSTLSGSGSTYFNLVYKDDAYNVYNALKSYFPEFNVKILHFDNIGVKVYR